jgi:Domain of unknown function (DUF4386)
MTIISIDESQRKAAKVVGVAYLLAIVPAIFAEFYVGQLIVNDNATQTALNIMAHERLFRLGIASNLIVCAVDIILITALYISLKPVNRSLALLAAFWGIVETSVLVIAVLSDLDVLRVLSGASYLGVFEANRLQALARLSVGAHGAAYNVGLVFAGLRSAVFCYLWFQSRFIPRSLATLGLFASFLLAACTFTFIIFPEARNVITISYYGGPIFIFELAMGFWLLLKGLRTFGLAEPMVESS